MKSGCRVVLTIFIGILLGILLTVGALVATGFWSYNNLSLNKLEGIIGQNIADLGEYDDMPIKELINEFSTITNSTVDQLDSKLLNNSIKNNLKISINGHEINLANNVFADLMNSKVSNALDKLNNLKNNINFGEIYTNVLVVAIPNLPEESAFYTKYKDSTLQLALDNLNKEPLESFLGESSLTDTSREVYDKLKTLSLEQISDSAILESKINELKLNNLLGISETSAGVLGALYTMDYTLAQLKEENSFDSLLINDILDIESTATGVLGAIQAQNWTLADLKVSSNFNSLSLNTILGLDDTSTGILKAIEVKDWTLADLTTANLNTLDLATILQISDGTTGLMGAIKTKGWKIQDLTSENINTLRLNEIITINASSSKILQTIQNSSISTLDADINDLRLANVLTLGEKDCDLNDDSIMDTYKGFIGIVMESDSNINGPKITDLQVKLEGLNSTIFSMQIDELVKREMLTISNYTTKKDNSVPTTSKTLKELTLQELVDYVTSTI